MPGPVFIHGKTVSLHPLEREDLSFFQTYRNHPDSRRPLGHAEPQSSAELEDEFEGRLQEGVSLVVCHEGEPVGFVALFNWKEAGHAELAYWIVPEQQGNGYATEAVSLAVDYAFDERRRHKVVAGVFATNAPSRGLLEKLGFRQEGRLREHAYLDGEYVDLLRYGLLESEWRGDDQA
ncbi:GNAT family N-acetyltransferase [Halovenus salina]|uniref:GNAT family N-acetyltransferase n=1 Tax=Halovenus salina TaxID=1510225 RepID=UPI0022609E22|nr:GNAT family protein [Halovenus salina]